MSEHIYQCPSCKNYTLHKTCTICVISTILPRPPKFSLDDKYGSYKREEKKKDLIKKGLY